MQSQVTEISPVLVEVEVTVPWDRVEKGLNDRFQRIAKTARIKGFRPGKVPSPLVRKLFRAEVVGAVTADLVEQGLMSAMREHAIYAVAQPSIDPPNIEDGQPFKFKAKMEVRPKIEHVDISKLDLERSPSQVTDDEVNAEVAKLQKEQGELQIPDPMRPAQKDDVLIIDYSVSLDGQAREDMGATARTVVLDSQTLIPELEKGLLQSQPGDTKEIEVKFAEDHGREELRNKSALFKVEVKELKERILPELDDEFAKDCGDYESLQDLRNKLRANLEAIAHEKAEAELKEKLVDRLIDTNNIPVPPSMIHQQENQLMQEIGMFLQMGSLPMTEELHSRLHARAERTVKAALLLGAVARENSIKVEPKDIDAQLENMAKASGKHIAKIKADFKGEKLESLESQLLEKKIMDFLMGKARISLATSTSGKMENQEATP